MDLTYDNVNAIKDMYSKVDSVEFELKYSLQSKRSGSEVMFFSKQIHRPKQEQKYIKTIQSEELQDGRKSSKNKDRSID